MLSGEELEMTVQRRLSSRNTTREVSVTLIVEDPDSAANEDGSSLIAGRNFAHPRL